MVYAKRDVPIATFHSRTSERTRLLLGGCHGSRRRVDRRQQRWLVVRMGGGPRAIGHLLGDEAGLRGLVAFRRLFVAIAHGFEDRFGLILLRLGVFPVC